VTETATSAAWYVYAVVGPVTPELRRAIEAEGALRLVGEGEVAAVVAPVPLAEFGEDVLPGRLNNRAWLEQKVLAHEDVLLGLAARTAVVPFRFGSIHRDLDAVEELLARRGEELARALDAVRGRVEFGVKAWWSKPVAPREPAATGRAYLERRLGERQQAGEATAAIEDALRDAHARFLACSLDGVLNRPQARELSGRSEEMVLNAAYLVASDDTSLAGEVAALGERYRDLGLSFELTGPWPAHNFVDLGDDA
jgi:hypothetical protein